MYFNNNYYTVNTTMLSKLQVLTVKYYGCVQKLEIDASLI